MGELCLSAFERPSQHEAVSDIIRRRSTNPTDVREAVLGGLDLTGARTILDLGCGFGFMCETIARRVAPDARIVGVDACPANAVPFLARVAAADRTGQFVLRHLEQRLDWPDASFDLVVASYSLYFFPEVLPEVVRVLRPDGLFLAVTHAEASYCDLAGVIGLPESGSALLCALRRFSAERGTEQLPPWFGQVRRVEYRNSLVFEASHQDELRTYLEFKLRLVASPAAAAGVAAEGLTPAAQLLASRGRVVLNKDDAAFQCTRPRCP